MKKAQRTWPQLLGFNLTAENMSRFETSCTGRRALITFLVVFHVCNVDDGFCGF